MQALGPAAIMVYLELSLLAISMALCAGLLVAGLAAWGTSKSRDEAPVSISLDPSFFTALLKGCIAKVHSIDCRFSLAMMHI